MEFQSSNRQRRVNLGHYVPPRWALTCVSTLAVGLEAGNGDAIEVVGGESGVGNQAEGTKES